MNSDKYKTPILLFGYMMLGLVLIAICI